MNPIREPLRWSEPESDAPRGLAAGVHALRAEDGSDAQVAALRARLAPQLAAPTTALSATAGAGATSSLWIKLGGALLFAGALGLYAFTRWSNGEVEHSPRAAPAAAARPTTTSQPAAEASAGNATPAPSVASAAPEPREPAGQRSGVRSTITRTSKNPSKARREHAISPPSHVTTPAPEAELALLQRAQTALDRDPGAALALAEQHAREHPAGVLSQERDMLAMEALVKLRRVPAALARAERFVRDYPTSPHNERVRALLERFRMLAPATIERDRIHPLDVSEATREP
jgi:hypothetical protein